MAPRAIQHKNLRPLTLSLTYHEGMPTKQYDPDLLNAALTGYQTKKTEIEQRIADVRQQLGQGSSSGTGGGAGAAMALERPRQQKRRHKISADGRRRIAEAQRKRWAATKNG